MFRFVFGCDLVGILVWVDLCNSIGVIVILWFVICLFWDVVCL